MPPLLRVLTGAGLGPRRACFRLIADGKVTVNGETVTQSTRDVDPAVDVIEADGRRVAAPEPHVYVKLNKPAGVLSAVTDARGRPTVTGLLPSEYRGLRLFPVGRLDMDSTGLVLMTNDGGLAYRLMHPSYGYEKEYHVVLKSPLTEADIRELVEGVLLDGQRTAPARVARFSEGSALRYAVTLAEGRKRQVRRMLASLGKPPTVLERVRIHTLRLGTLAPGEAAPLSAEELEALRA
ncbi:MAG: pseudouridine synthase [Chloroflexota bacterium]|nr:pseudouridine synthase [Chloroflexota bacterium]